MPWLELALSWMNRRGMIVITGRMRNGTLGEPGVGIGISVGWYVLELSTSLAMQPLINHNISIRHILKHTPIRLELWPLKKSRVLPSQLHYF